MPVGEPKLGVVITTAGGLVAGDRLDLAVRVAEDAAAHITSAAAEKVYRSTGATVRVRQHLRVAAGARLEFLPPETIVFDSARLRRTAIVELGSGAGFLGGGILVFGRRARGEAFTAGLLHEVWEVWRDGMLVWGDAFHLDGDVAATIADPAGLDGAAASAMLILAPPGRDPRGFIDAARERQQRSVSPGLRGGITVVSDLLVARWLGADALLVRRAYADLACHLRQAALGLPPRLPRLWQL